jgi:hypothetical protein
MVAHKLQVKVPSLYERGERISLRIRGGMLEIGALQRPGFGYDLPIRVDERSPVP